MNKNKFFHFSQNNSGGFFDGPKHIIIEARDAGEANEIAEAKGGIYFGGVASGRDCECCGNRWSMAYGDGDDTPLVYGNEPDENETLIIRKD